MKAAISKILVWVLFSTLLAGCGGGATGTSGSTSNVYISGSVDFGLWPISAGSSQTQLQYMSTLVVATSSFNGAPISNASVSINGTQLAFDAATNRFGGLVVPDAAGKFALTVVANGETHTATATAITSRPIITLPATFVAAQSNTISWSAAGGVVAGVTPISYTIEVTNPNDYSATRIAYSAGTTSLNTIVPANSTISGTSYYARIHGVYISSMIPTAASGSLFAVSTSSDIAYFTPQ